MDSLKVISRSWGKNNQLCFSTGGDETVITGYRLLNPAFPGKSGVFV
jgi:hypothetical protein